MPVFNDADAKASKECARRGGYVVRETPRRRLHSGRDRFRSRTLPGGERRSWPPRASPPGSWRCRAGDASTPSRATTDAAVLRRGTPSVSLEAGATLGWTKYVDQAIGIDSFGMSAPGSYVMDYFNMNAATLVAHVHEVLGDAR